MVWSLLGRAQADKPTHGAAVFDAKGKTFRHDIYPPYKANRDPARRLELDAQFPYMHHAANALGFQAVELKGFEADDILATLAYRAKKLGIRTTIVSTDKDMLQCVEDGVIEVVDPILRERKAADGTTERVRKRMLEADVRKKFGVRPMLVPDVQALWGDAVDNIPGIEGIGGKTAGALIKQFGSLEALIEAANKSGVVVGTPAIRKAIRKHADDARLFKRLATLRTDVPIEIEMRSLLLHEPERAHIKEMLHVLEADHKFDIMFTVNPDLTMKAPHDPTPSQWWTRALKTKQPVPDVPQVGFYKRRLVVGGVWVPCRIWREAEKDFETEKPTGMDVILCEVNGKPRSALQQWDTLARMPIKKSDYDFRIATGQWAREFAPDSSEAHPERAIDWNVEPL